jgi:hypothetical protein
MLWDLASGAKALGLRFTIGGIFPFFFLVWFAFFLVTVAQVRPKESLITALTTRTHDLSAAEWGVLILGSFLLAVVTQPFQIAVVRLLEGYWGASDAIGHLREVCSELHRRRRHYLHMQRILACENDHLQVMAYLTRQLDRYPSPNEIMPTLLGNTLRASERLAGERYGLDTVRSWSRLYYELPDPLQRDVADLHGQVDGGVRLAIALGMAGLAGLPVLFANGWWNLVWIGAMVLSWVAYRGAIAAASDLGAILAAAFDLHRFDLLSALHLPLPDDLTEERAHNKLLTAFLAGSTDLGPLPPGIKYRHPEQMSPVHPSATPPGD